jgi:hypothetical protein
MVCVEWNENFDDVGVLETVGWASEVEGRAACRRGTSSPLGISEFLLSGKLFDVPVCQGECDKESATTSSSPSEVIEVDAEVTESPRDRPLMLDSSTLASTLAISAGDIICCGVYSCVGRRGLSNVCS